VKALAQAVAYATDRYRYGFASYFEVLEAQQQFYPAQNTPTRSAPRARPALRGARGRLEPDRCRVERPGERKRRLILVLSGSCEDPPRAAPRARPLTKAPGHHQPPQQQPP